MLPLIFLVIVSYVIKVLVCKIIHWILGSKSDRLPETNFSNLSHRETKQNLRPTSKLESRINTKDRQHNNSFVKSQQSRNLGSQVKTRKCKCNSENEARLDPQHIQEMLKIQNTENENERKNKLLLMQAEFEHTRQMHSQQTTAIEAAFSACVLQSIQAGKCVDKDLLLAVRCRVNSPGESTDSLLTK